MLCYIYLTEIVTDLTGTALEALGKLQVGKRDASKLKSHFMAMTKKVCCTCIILQSMYGNQSAYEIWVFFKYCFG